MEGKSEAMSPVQRDGTQKFDMSERLNLLWIFPVQSLSCACQIIKISKRLEEERLR